MTELARLRVTITGAGVVGPSVLTLYVDWGINGGMPNVRNGLNTMLTAMKAGFPPEVIYTIPNSGDLIDAATGDLIDVWTSGATMTVQGTSAAGFAQGVGVRVLLKTAGVTNNRRVTGTMFLVPVSKDLFTGAGGIDDAVRTNWLGYAAAFLTTAGGALQVWSRPKGARVGVAHPVLSTFIPDAVSWLRSRRT